MRVSGYLGVVAAYVATALLSFVVLSLLKREETQFSLVAAAIIGAQLGTWLWFRQSPQTSEAGVKAVLGITLAATAILYGVVSQAVHPWLEHPEISIPISAIGSLFFPFATSGPLWKSLHKDAAAKQAGRQ